MIKITIIKIIKWSAETTKNAAEIAKTKKKQ